jgi:hypothetical protein
MDSPNFFTDVDEGEGPSPSPSSDGKPKRIRRRKPGDLAQLRAVLWGVLLDVESICADEAGDNAMKIKAAHSLATLAGAYLKVTETHDLEKRLEALEAVNHATKVTN